MRVSLLTVFRTAGKYLVQRFGSDNDVLQTYCPLTFPPTWLDAPGHPGGVAGLMAMVVGDGWIELPGGGTKLRASPKYKFPSANHGA